MKSIYETLIDSGDFQKLIGAVRAAGMEGMLTNEGPYTCFAPTDEAFHRFPSEAWEEILNDRERLSGLLRHHILEGRISAKDLRKMRSVNDLDGERMYLDLTNDIHVDHATITEPDIRCSNGIAHGISEVLVPVKVKIPA